MAKTLCNEVIKPKVGTRLLAVLKAPTIIQFISPTGFEALQGQAPYIIHLCVPCTE